MIARTARCAGRGRCALVGLVLISMATLTGCASQYATPGRAADFKAMGFNREAQTDAGVAQTLSKQPLASFPTGIAAVRVQAPDYHSDTAERFGSGNYCVITTRDVEKDGDWERLRKDLPMVTGIAPINRLLLPQQLNSDLELRQAAAALHADVLLIYTIDTTFHVEDHLAPLTVVTLGLSPNQTVQMVSTASAVLMDTRNGYLYGYSEATQKGIQLTSGWTTEAAVKDARKRTESQVFAKLVDGLRGTWQGVVSNYAGPNPAKAAGASVPLNQ